MAVTRINLCKHQKTAVFDLKLMVGWGEHKVVLDESRFSTPPTYAAINARSWHSGIIRALLMNTLINSGIPPGATPL